MRLHLLAALVVCATSPAAWAVYKCPGADGRTTFQEMPCAAGEQKLDVQPASGAGPRPAAGISSSAAGSRQSEAQRLDAAFADSQRGRRAREVEQVEIPGAEDTLRKLRQQCDADLAELQARKGQANNNLAGATWQVSLSGEMSALATRCDTKQRELSEKIEALRKECASLGGCNR